MTFVGCVVVGRVSHVSITKVIKDKVSVTVGFVHGNQVEYAKEKGRVQWVNLLI